MTPAARGEMTQRRSVAQELEKAAPRLRNILGTEAKLERFKSVVMDALSDDRIAACEPASIIKAALDAAKVDLEVNTPRQQAWLVPYKGKATLQIGYHGWLAIAKRDGAVRAVTAEVVHEGDHFEWDTARGIIKHQASHGLERPGKPICVYARLVLSDGTEIFELLPGWLIQDIKKASKARSGDRQNPWDGPFAERMWRKTAVAFACRQHLDAPRVQQLLALDREELPESEPPMRSANVVVDVEPEPEPLEQISRPETPEEPPWTDEEEPPPPSAPPPAPEPTKPPVSAKPTGQSGKVPRPKLEANLWNAGRAARLNDAELLSELRQHFDLGDAPAEDPFRHLNDADLVGGIELIQGLVRR